MAVAYERVVNGKVIKVNGYGDTSTTTTTAAKTAQKLPGRPRMAAQPGSYSSGRDIPGQPARRQAPQPLPVPAKKGAVPGGRA